MALFRENLLARFAVLTFGFMVLLAVGTGSLMYWNMKQELVLLGAHGAAMMSGMSMTAPDDPLSIPSITTAFKELRLATLASLVGGLAVLYSGSLYIVWRGWLLIKQQQETLGEMAEKDHERITELQTLFDIASILAGPGTLLEKTNKVLEMTMAVVGAGRAVLRLPHAESGDLLVYAAAGPLLSTHPPKLAIRPDSGGVTSRAFTDGTVIIDNEHEPGGRTGRAIEGLATRSTVGLPIRDGAVVSGVLQVGSIDVGFFSARNVALLTAIADSLGVLILNARLRETIEVERALAERKDNFIAIASHELRTPMTMVLGYTELLLEAEPPAKQRIEWYRSINVEAKRLTGIIEELFDVSRIQSGNLQIDSHPLAMRPLASHLAVVPIDVVYK